MGIILKQDEEQSDLQRKIAADLRQRLVSAEDKKSLAVTDFSQLAEPDVSKKELLIVGTIIFVIVVILIFWMA